MGWEILGSHLSQCFRLALRVCSGATGLFVLWPCPTPLCPSAEVNTGITFFVASLCAESKSVKCYVITYYRFILFSCIFYGKTSGTATQTGLHEEPQQKGTLHWDGNRF